MSFRLWLVLAPISQFKKDTHNTFQHFSTLRQTIFALSSGQGKCGVAVVRVSGPDAKSALAAVAGPNRLKPRLAQLSVLRDPRSQEVLDKAVVLWFPGPRSFTGEDSCEFQVHGGLAVVSGVLTALSKIPGLRAAEPGEFSKRAFFNGKMDLTEAEGLADLIHAETEMQRKQALLQMQGSLHALYYNWRDILIKCVGHVEAYIDFSEDENIEDGVMEVVEKSVENLCETMEAHLADGRRGERLRDGIQAAIVGEPNVGKSTLLNTLCCRPAAIVTPIAGTTRDIVQQYINIGGYPLSLADTAGLRRISETNDQVEVEGIARALSLAETVDLVVLVVEATRFSKLLDGHVEKPCHLFQTLLEEHTKHLGLKTIDSNKLLDSPELSLSKDHSQTQYFFVLSKADLIEDENLKKILLDFSQRYPNVVLLSCATQEGVSALLSKLQLKLEILCGNPSRESPTLSQVRHRQHLSDCLLHLQHYLIDSTSASNLTDDIQNIKITPQPDLALKAEELRRALFSLGKVTGHVTTEQVLDIIFRDFCIGK